MKKSITHGGRSRKVVVRITRRPVNQEWASNDVLAGNEPPKAAVPAVVAIVAQNKIVPLGNNQLVVFNEFRHFFPPFRVHFEGGRTRLRKIVEIDIAQLIVVLGVGLSQGHSIDKHTLVDETQAIAGQGHYSLYEVLRRIHRIMEDDDVTAPDAAIGQQTVPTAVAAVTKFIHQQVIADEQCLLHGF